MLPNKPATAGILTKKNSLKCVFEIPGHITEFINIYFWVSNPANVIKPKSNSKFHVTAMLFEPTTT